jgi:hypothetical protein
MVCSKQRFQENCVSLGLDIEWPESPVKTTTTPTGKEPTFDWPATGNVLVAGLKTGYEIPDILKQLNHDQKVFVVEEDPNIWIAAASDSTTSEWPLRTSLFIFKSYASLVGFFELTTDLMPPTEVIAYGHGLSQAQPHLTVIQKTWSEKLSILKRSYVSFLSKASERRYACISPDCSGEQLMVEMFGKILEAENLSFKQYGNAAYAPRQITPFWLMERLLKDGITDMLVINRSRQDLYPLIPLECRFITMATDPIPEIMEPGAQAPMSDLDRVLPLNEFIAELCAEKLPLQSCEKQIIPSLILQTKDWSEREYEIVAMGDAPDFTFETRLLKHPTMGALFVKFKQMLLNASDFVSDQELDQLFTNAEKMVDCYIQDKAQRKWLLALIRVLVVGAHNKRNILLELVREQPDIPLRLMGHGWEREVELKPYIHDRGSETRLETLAKTKLLILGEGLREKLPSPEMIAAMSSGCTVLAALNAEDEDPFDVKAIVRIDSLDDFVKSSQRLLADAEEAQLVAKLGQATIGFLDKSFTGL